MYDNSLWGMPVFTFRLDDHVAQRFDAVAGTAGGRSALLRRLILAAVGEPEGAAPAAAPRRDRVTRRVEIRLTDGEIAALDAEADALGMKRTDWVTVLVRRRLNGSAPLPLAERTAVAQAWRELNRIGINLNQAARALNASVMVDSGLDVAREAARVADFRTEIRGALVGLGAALKGDLAYWESDDG